MLVTSLIGPTGSAKGKQQDDGSCHVQMQANPCYAVIHQGLGEDRNEYITMHGHVQMEENPSYIHNTIALTAHYQNISLHDKLDRNWYKV